VIAPPALVTSPLFLTSSLLPVPHGFSLRHGGVSAPPYASLNFGRATRDEPAHVRANYGRLAANLGVALGNLRTVSQVHGDAVHLAMPGTGGEALAPPECEADAVWTDAPETWTSVLTADCVPILLVDPVHHRVGAVHSGWKGTLAEISLRLVERWREQGSEPAKLLAAVGPSIRRCCYSVSASLAADFASAFGSDVVVEEAGVARLDLAGAVVRSLERAGLAAAHIDVLPSCTACEPAHYFSHRRDEGVTGRHLNFVMHRF